MSFFDTRHGVDRAWYAVDKTYDFILSGLAYKARPAALNRLLPPEDEDFVVEAGATLSLDGVALLLPVEGRDMDEYRFRGPVKQVEPFFDGLGQDGWRVRVTVMR